MKPHELGIAVVIAAAVLAWFLRSASGDKEDEEQDGGDEAGQAREREPAREPDEEPAGDAGAGEEHPWPVDEDLTEEEIAEARQLTVITSDGWAFVPREHAVQLLPPASEDELAMQAAHARRVEGGGLPGVAVSPGDLVGARVVRGAPDSDPWRLEGLGRDREYQAWAFETEDAARSALEMLEHLIVRPPVDEFGDPAPLTDADFAEAKRIYDETVQELANMPDVEDEEQGPPPIS